MYSHPDRYHNKQLCFFFQAEDGIRDLYVTGVQTCALPISFLQVSLQVEPLKAERGSRRFAMDETRKITRLRIQPALKNLYAGRSEERREGKSVDLGGRPIIKKKNSEY